MTAILFRGLLFLFCLQALVAQEKTPDKSPSPSTDTPELKGVMVKLSDYGSDDVAYLSLPAVPPTGGIVVLHDKFGLTSAMKQRADQFAEEGFVVLGIDLFNGQSATEESRALELVKNVDQKSALKTIASAVRFLRESPRFRTERVGAVGLGFSAGIILQAALVPKGSGLNAIALYYGPTESEEKKLERLRAVLLGFYASKDSLVGPESVKTFDQTLTQLNKPHEFQTLESEAGFASPGSPEFNPQMANKCWKQNVGFFRRELGIQPAEKNLFQKVFE